MGRILTVCPNPRCLFSISHFLSLGLGPWAYCSYHTASGEPAFPFHLCRVYPTTSQSEGEELLGPSALLHFKMRSTQQWHQQEFCHESETDISTWGCMQM